MKRMIEMTSGRKGVDVMRFKPGEITVASPDRVILDPSTEINQSGNPVSGGIVLTKLIICASCNKQRG